MKETVFFATFPVSFPTTLGRGETGSTLAPLSGSKWRRRRNRLTFDGTGLFLFPMDLGITLWSRFLGVYFHGISGWFRLEHRFQHVFMEFSRHGYTMMWFLSSWIGPWVRSGFSYQQLHSHGHFSTVPASIFDLLLLGTPFRGAVTADVVRNLHTSRRGLRRTSLPARGNKKETFSRKSFCERKTNGLFAAYCIAHTHDHTYARTYTHSSHRQSNAHPTTGPTTSRERDTSNTTLLQQQQPFKEPLKSRKISHS